MIVFIQTTRSAPTKSSPRPCCTSQERAQGQGRGTCCSCPCRGRSRWNLGCLGTIQTTPTACPCREPRMGCPVPDWGWDLKVAPLNNTPFRVGGLALDTSCLWARMSRSFIHQACCHSPPTVGQEAGHVWSLTNHGDPEGGSPHDAPSLGLRPAGGCTLPGQRTFSRRPRSGQHSGTSSSQ